MIKYNFQRINQLCNWDEVSVLQYFCFREKIWLPDYLPKEYSNNLYKEARNPYPQGYNYLLNIRPVLINKEGYFLHEIYQYIALASKRSYFDWKLKNISSLPMVFIEGKIYSNNPLLEIKDNNIYFKYEEQMKQRNTYGS